MFPRENFEILLMCCFGILANCLIQHISEHILILQEKIPAFSTDSCKKNLGDHFREALLEGSVGIIPRENFEILVLVGGI